MTIDRYTKAVLTVIAIGLMLLGLNPWVQPTPTEAGLMESRYQMASIGGFGVLILVSKNSQLRGCALIGKEGLRCLPWINMQ